MKPEEILQFGEFEVDPQRRRFRRNETPVALNRRAFDVLVYLLHHPGRVVSKDELLKNVWTDAYVDENNLTQSISAVRRALAETPGENAYIKTVSGRGYQFVVPVQTLSSITESGPQLSALSPQSGVGVIVQKLNVTTTVSAETQEIPALESSGWRWVTGLIGITTLGVVGSYFVWAHFHPKPTEATVVIAEFLNSTGDPTFDHILNRALEIDLGQSPYMDVMSDRAVIAELQLMGKPIDSTLSSELARQVCERNNRQTLLAGSIAGVGSKYLLSLEAINCNNGEKLAAAKTEASSKEEVLGALDEVADRVRSKLGESAKSVAKFRVPIAQVTTPSLEALKAFSLGHYLDAQGKPASEALSSYQQAILLDPNFAVAYGEIATHYYNLNEYRLASQYYKKAFDLSDHVGAKEQFIIRAHYYAEGVGDRLLGIKTYQVWAATYPLEWVPWANLANQYTQLGLYGPAIGAGQEALQRAQNYSTYLVLARAYKRAGDFPEVKNVAAKAQMQGKTSDSMHALLYEVAVAEHDAGGMAQQISWSGMHPGWYFLDYEANAAGTRGQYRQAKGFFDQSYAAAERDDLTEAADNVLEDEATLELQMGLVSAAKATLGRVRSSSRDSGEEAILHAEIGDLAFAESFLTAHSGEQTSDTDMQYMLLPRLRAAIAMQQHKAFLVGAALEPSAPYELAYYDILSERGAAYLKVGQGSAAVAQYRRILANPGVNGISAFYQLAHLGLARSLAMIGDKDASRAEYAAFLQNWKDGDVDLPVLRAAKAEFAGLRTQ